jgi:hypothetical protein
MWEADLEDASRRRVALLIGSVAVALAAVGGWYWYASRHVPPVEPPAAPAVAPAPEASGESKVAHPLPAEGAGNVALPALNDSDQLADDSLAGVLGRKLVEQFLVPHSIVRHIVVTVDNLPRRKLAVELRPLKPTPGPTLIASQCELTALSDANFARYAPLMRMVQDADVKSLAVVYQRLYPLFQQAYEDLGYPGKYFNDRLVEVIDHLLQAPEVQGAVRVVQPKVFYEYADADLEGRSAGQKLLVRMGPANERIIKEKLRAFRAEIVKNK